jgi:hypothetical protein
MERHRVFHPKRHSPVSSLSALCLVAIFTGGPAIAQTTDGTTPTTTQQQFDINQLLQALGGLNGLGGLIGQSGGTTNGDTTTDGTTPTNGTPTNGTTTPGTTERVPFIIEDQFTTTRGAAVGARSPGLWVRQAIAVQDGSVTISAASADEPFGGNFIADTTQQITLAIIDVWQNVLDTVNTAIAVLSGSSLTNSGSSSGNSNSDSATTGAGTTTPVQ